ncbi:MAG: serine/threonine protein kinase [Kiritimatiellia bacterium]|jgi:serine/threonine protein kinase
MAPEDLRLVYPRPYAQYTLLERIAVGGMSEIDLARHQLEDAGYVRFVVIKRIKTDHIEDDTFVRMFKDEARITSELRHTNIAQLYDFGRVEDEYYLVLEYVPGTDLRVVLKGLKKRRQRMPARLSLRVISDVLSALDYAHTRKDQLGRPMNIVHRDVNPRNIMVSLTGEVKLIDFGVAWAEDRLEHTMTDHFKGKVAYMAPEQISGGRRLDHRVDVYAAGLTLYEMLYGRGAFSGLDQTQIIYKILNDDVPPLCLPREWGQVGRDLVELVHKALAHDPDERFADAGAMKLRVDEVARNFGGMAHRDELVDFVHKLDPGLEDRLRSKMRSWTGRSAAPTELSPFPPDLGDGSISDGTANLPLASTLSTAPEKPPTRRISRPVVVAGVFGTFGLFAVLAIIGMLLVGTAVFWLMSSFSAGSVASPDPAAQERAEGDLQPETTPKSDPAEGSDSAVRDPPSKAVSSARPLRIGLQERPADP